jgi:hypothetical protein
MIVVVVDGEIAGLTGTTAGIVAGFTVAGSLNVGRSATRPPFSKATVVKPACTADWTCVRVLMSDVLEDSVMATVFVSASTD